jgi:phosphatidylserine/phosphatidylglycerophosphate/cardiolipin synthase-like enzyme
MRRGADEELQAAEEIARPAYAWLGERRLVRNLQGREITNVAGGIGFRVYNYGYEKRLKVRLLVERQDGAREYYLTDCYYCGEWEKDWEKWQTHRLPLFPFESCHGQAIRISFSYRVGDEARLLPSAYTYHFATLQDFHKGYLEENGLEARHVEETGEEATNFPDAGRLQTALQRINRENQLARIKPYFTRGNIQRGEHPVHEIHRCIDRVIEQTRRQPHRQHYIHLAMFDFDNEHVANHLVYAYDNGVDVECIGDWAQVSPMNDSEHIARIRRTGIPIYGVVRNTPGVPADGIASMHTKFIVFDGEVVHSSSYNLHFHLWGGNWENALFYYSQDFAALYEGIYGAIRDGHVPVVRINPEDRYNLYYSFGTYLARDQGFGPQDAIITEIERAKQSIVVCMFSLSYLGGKSMLTGRETDVISALIAARDRGMRVQIILNGMVARVGPIPEPWDWNEEVRRPLSGPMQQLREAWMEVVYVYYPWSIYSPLHHKFAIFDGEVVITESYNWYEASTQSDEVLSVLRDRRIARDFMEEAALILRTFRCVKG